MSVTTSRTGILRRRFKREQGAQSIHTAPSSKMWSLTINGPGYFDTAYDLPEGVTMMGRADENDIVLSGDLVSRKHARITVKGDLLTVEDLGSRNGSKVNGEPLTTLVTIKAGDL